jgi:hypothetical protein
MNIAIFFLAKLQCDTSSIALKDVATIATHIDHLSSQIF